MDVVRWSVSGRDVLWSCRVRRRVVDLTANRPDGIAVRCQRASTGETAVARGREADRAGRIGSAGTSGVHNLDGNRGRIAHKGGISSERDASRR